MTGNKLFTMLGYGDNFGLDVRSLDFRTEGMPVDEACEVIKMWIATISLTVRR
jgi:hypothetical protein